MTVFTEVCVTVDGEAAEVVAEVLLPFAYQESVIFEQRGDDSDPDPNSLEPVVTVKIYLIDRADTADVRQRIREVLYHLNRLYPIPAPRFNQLAEEDWSNAWKKHYHPLRVGNRLLIVPSWQVDQLQATSDSSTTANDIRIILDPGMAFGTGLHPTTQMCMAALEDEIYSGARVLDVGTGSGILSVTAAKLGAGRVRGVDTDPIAVKAATQNAERNGVANICSFSEGTLSSETDRRWDVVAVNILAPVIIELLDQDNLLDYLAADGLLLLSGIIEEQMGQVEASLLEAGGMIVRRLQIRDWVTVVAQTKSV